MRITKFVQALLVGGLIGGAAAYGDVFDVDGSHSQIGFKVKHLAISTVSGSFTNFSGSLEFEPGKIETLKLKGTVQVASVNTANAKRDAHLRSDDFFATDKHATMTFESAKAKKAGKSGVELSGKLTIRGVTKPVTLKGELSEVVKDPWGNTKVGFAAETTINRQDYGLAWSKALESGGLVVGNDVRIIIELEAKKR